MSRPDDALEAGLRALAEGKSVEEALSGLKGDSPELERLLRAAAQAREAGGAELRAEARRRIRTKFLRVASEMREVSARKRRRIIPAFPRVAITLGLVALLILTSTGLVSASSSAVPGDQLYRVKRSWEDIRLLLSARPAVQYMLASEFEQERLDEIEKLLTRGRSAPIMFSGVVSMKQDGTWTVSGIPVFVPGTASLPPGSILAGQPVLVTGVTRADGAVEAQRIDLLGPGSALPPLGPSINGDRSENGGVPEAEGLKSEPAEADGRLAYATYDFTGIVERMGIDAWQVNRQQVRVDQATIIGKITVGGEIKFEGYYAPNGTLIATRIEATSNLRYDDGRDHEKQSSGSGDAPGESSDDGGSEVDD